MRRIDANKPDKTGYKRQLVERDIWEVNPNRTADLLTQKVKEAFQRRVKAGTKRPLVGALYETFKLEFILSGTFAMIYYSLQILTPFVLRYLIQFAQDAYKAQAQGQPTPPIAHGIGLVLGISVMQIMQSVAASQYFYKGMMLGGQSRGVLTGMIYEKAMTISSRAKAGGISNSLEVNDTDKSNQNESTNGNEKSDSKDWKKARDQKKKDDFESGIGWNNGRISTLMNIDTNRIDSFSTALHSLWATPLACSISLILLLINLSYSALAGFALLVVGVPMFTITLRSLLSRRRSINKLTDQRMSLTQEIIQSVRFVKFFGWEPAFLDRLDRIRMTEIRAIQALLAVRNAINAVSMSLPIFASMLSFITYSLTDSGLEPAKAFSSLALFNSLRLPLNSLPRALGDATDAWSSLKRIETFMLEEEREEVMVWKPEGEYALELRSASFTREQQRKQEKDEGKAPAHAIDKKSKTDPEKSSTVKSTTSSDDTAAVDERGPFQLQDVNFKAGRNELIAVIGTVGSGKTSLLTALAGQMRKTNGEATFGASRAFCPQYAWIQNTSLQNNITFGKKFDEDWYRKVIDA
jgi:ABC-type multidrug transport system fused ATPase/permease subunit